MARGSCAVVQHLATEPETMGLNLAAAQHQEKMMEENVSKK
jgi:hypothetical protein